MRAVLQYFVLNRHRQTLILNHYVESVTFLVSIQEHNRSFFISIWLRYLSIFPLVINHERTFHLSPHTTPLGKGGRG